MVWVPQKQSFYLTLQMALTVKRQAVWKILTIHILGVLDNKSFSLICFHFSPFEAHLGKESQRANIWQIQELRLCRGKKCSLRLSFPKTQGKVRFKKQGFNSHHQLFLHPDYLLLPRWVGGREAVPFFCNLHTLQRSWFQPIFNEHYHIICLII